MHKFTRKASSAAFRRGFLLWATIAAGAVSAVDMPQKEAADAELAGNNNVLINADVSSNGEGSIYLGFDQTRIDINGDQVSTGTVGVRVTTGGTTLYNNTTIEKSASVGTSLDVGGDIRVNGAIFDGNDSSVNIGEDLAVAGSAAVSANLTVNGTISDGNDDTVNIADNLAVNGIITDGNDDTVNIGENIAIAGNATISSDLTLDGTISDGSDDTVNISENLDVAGATSSLGLSNTGTLSQIGTTNINTTGSAATAIGNSGSETAVSATAGNAALSLSQDNASLMLGSHGLDIDGESATTTLSGGTNSASLALQDARATLAVGTATSSETDVLIVNGSDVGDDRTTTSVTLGGSNNTATQLISGANSLQINDGLGSNPALSLTGTLDDSSTATTGVLITGSAQKAPFDPTATIPTPSWADVAIQSAHYNGEGTGSAILITDYGVQIISPQPVAGQDIHNNIGLNYGAGNVINNLGGGTGATQNNIGVGSGVSTTTIGSTTAGSAVTTQAGNTATRIINGASTTQLTAGDGVGDSVLVDSSNGTTTAHSGTVLKGAVAVHTTADQFGKLTTTESAAEVAQSSATITVTNGDGNTHGFYVDEQRAVISGGRYSSAMILDDRGATFGNTSNGNPIQVHGVYDGSADFDAVNVRQLKKSYAGIAGVAALSQITAPLEGKRYSFGIGAGHFEGEEALALGFKARYKNTTVLSFGATHDTQDRNVVAAGATWSW